MNNQTESFIVLKPIAERFSRIANEMTDDEIKNLIKSELREQLKTCEFGRIVGYIIDEYFDDESKVETINKLIEESVKDKFR
jgi:hypothetical protein